MYDNSGYAEQRKDYDNAKQHYDYTLLSSGTVVHTLFLMQATFQRVRKRKKMAFVYM
jgi:hypothetical protein